MAKYLAEAVGTFILVLVGTMSVVAAQLAEIHPLAIAPFGFGLGLLAAIYAVGHISGGHFNPAVTLGMWLDKRLPTADVAGYVGAQLVGATLGSVGLLLLSDSDAVAGTANTFNGLTSVGFVSEFLLTMIFVLVILASTRWAPRGAPFVIALTLTAVHFAGIPFSGASVNPARSFGPALIGGQMGELWLYVVAPLLGAAAAVALHRALPVSEES